MNREPLPDHLPDAFSVAAALRDGLTPDRLRGLPAPFRGVRTLEPVGDSIVDLVRAFAPRLREGQFFSHRTSALLWKMPLPGFATMPLHVAAPVSGRPPSGRGIVGHRLSVEPSEIAMIVGVPVLSAARTWALLAQECAIHDVIAVGEYLITGTSLARPCPVVPIESLRAVTKRLSGQRGHRIRVAALSALRIGPLSRPESLVRFLLVRAGIPEPEINTECVDADGNLIAVPDLRWPQFKVAIEYEGDYHRDSTQFRRDIHRMERLVDQGWLVVKVSADDLFARPEELVARVSRRLTSRGWLGRAEIRFSGHMQR